MLPPKQEVATNCNNKQLTKVFFDYDGCILYSSFDLSELSSLIKENKTEVLYNTPCHILKKLAKSAYKKNELLFKNIIENSTQDIIFYSESAPQDYEYNLINPSVLYKNKSLDNTLFSLLINGAKTKYPKKKDINPFSKPRVNKNEPLFKYKESKELVSSAKSGDIKKVIVYRAAKKDNCTQLPPLLIFVDDSSIYLSSYIKPIRNEFKKDEKIDGFVLISYDGEIDLQYNSKDDSIKINNKPYYMFDITEQLNYKIDDDYTSIESINKNNDNVATDKTDNDSSSNLSPEEGVNDGDIKSYIQANFNF